MTGHDKHLILQACAFAREFIKEAERELCWDGANVAHAQAQLRAALDALEPPAPTERICTCGHTQFHHLGAVASVDLIGAFTSVDLSGGPCIWSSCECKAFTDKEEALHDDQL